MQRRHLFSTALGLTALQAAGAVGAKSTPSASGGARQDGMVVQAVQMPAWTSRDGRRQPIAPGDVIRQSGEVQTSSQAAIVLSLPEGSLVRLGENTRLGIQKLEVNTDTGRTAVQSELKLFDGFFRFATSAVAKVAGQRQIDVSVRTATIGIRGTDFWTMTDEKHDATCLFEGKVDLQTRDQGALTLDAPTAFWARFFDQPVKPVGQATPAELQKFIKTTELQPGQGVAIQGGRWRVVAAALPSAPAAAALVKKLREDGYPAVIRIKTVAKTEVHEVRINHFASREDAAAVLARIAGVDGVQGRVALSA